jgi:uncharacterized protein YggE
MKDNISKILPGLLIIAFFFLALFLYSHLVGPIPFSVNSITTVKSDIFSVTGEGKSVVKPDIAYVRVGIEANGSTVKQTQTQINTVINNVSKALKGLGVSEDDIKTTNYSIRPNYDWREGRQRITGYQASTSLSVKVREIDKINEVIDSATANGANQVGSISFDVDDRTKAENEARQEAVAEAKRKAQEAARIAGFKLGKIINYSEGGNSYRPLMDSVRLPVSGGGEMAKTEIEPGTSEITVMVTLSYQIE